jgi:hypothetical protein
MLAEIHVEDEINWGGFGKRFCNIPQIRASTFYHLQAFNGYIFSHQLSESL